jgi:hypothetical protein
VWFTSLPAWTGAVFALCCGLELLSLLLGRYGALCLEPQKVIWGAQGARQRQRLCCVTLVAFSPLGAERVSSCV